MVERGSMHNAADGVTVQFVVSDGKARVPVRFSGIRPALFVEGSGVVAEGRLGADGTFVADNLLAVGPRMFDLSRTKGFTQKTREVTGPFIAVDASGKPVQGTIVAKAGTVTVSARGATVVLGPGAEAKGHTPPWLLCEIEDGLFPFPACRGAEL